MINEYQAAQVLGLKGEINNADIKRAYREMSPITLFDGHLFKLFDGKNSSLLMKK